MSENETYASFWDHVQELRGVLIRILACIAIGSLVSFSFYEAIIRFLTSPLAKNSFPHLAPTQLVLLGPLEGMMIALKTSVWVGIVATSPVWLYQIFRFISPALRDNERTIIILFFLASFLFIFLGSLFAFLVTIPIANTFLTSFNGGIGVNMWSLAQYLDYTLFLLLANGLAFELGVLGIFAVHLRVVSVERLKESRRIAILLAFILGALLTPPDVFSQVMLAIPLILLYEGLILYAYWLD